MQQVESGPILQVNTIIGVSDCDVFGHIDEKSPA